MEASKHNLTVIQRTIINLFLSGRTVTCIGENFSENWSGKFISIDRDGTVTIIPRKGEFSRKRGDINPDGEYRPLEAIQLPFLESPYDELKNILPILLGLVTD